MKAIFINAGERNVTAIKLEYNLQVAMVKYSGCFF